MNLDPAWIALIATVMGGVGLKVTEHWLSRSRVKIDDATQMRNELRLEITAQREEIKALEAEVDKWRKEYYDLREEYFSLKTDLALALDRIKQETIDAEARAQENR